MSNTIKKIDNPLTIMAVFSGITEIAAASALPFLTAPVQEKFVWFLIIFPFVLITGFFLTLNFNTKALYAPGDYRDDKHFLDALKISSRAVEVRVTDSNSNIPKIEQIPPANLPPGTSSPFDGISKHQLDAANAFMQEFSEHAKRLFKADMVTDWSFGVHGEGLFVFTAGIKPFDNRLPKHNETFILRTRELSNSRVEMSIVGSKFSSTDPCEFAMIVSQLLESTAKRQRRHPTGDDTEHPEPPQLSE